MKETSSSKSISTKLERIAKMAKSMPGVPLSTLGYHMDIKWLHEAYRRTRKDAAVGVDGQTAAEYEANLEANLRSLLDRAKSGDHYRAPPVRRVYIPKGGDDTKLRPIGIPSFEDKVLQRAVAMVLEAVYEQDFLDCSYGFRPGRSAHQAVQSVWKQAMDMGGCWVLEVDIEDFFGSLDKAKLREIFCQRIRDGVLVRLIGKWLNAGVMDEGCIYHPETGVPQGGVITPPTQVQTLSGGLGCRGIRCGQAPPTIARSLDNCGGYREHFYSFVGPFGSLAQGRVPDASISAHSDGVRANAALGGISAQCV